MEIVTDTVADEQKNTCAIRLMRTMLINFSGKYGMPFDDALLLFADSPVYDMLFDYETTVWREGPDYLMMLFEEALSRHTDGT